MNPGINKIESAEFADGKIRVKGRFSVRSTGWTVSSTTTTDSDGRIAEIRITPTPPPAGHMVGWGFPSDGQEFDISITGDFAPIVSVVLIKAQMPLDVISLEIESDKEQTR